MVDQIIRYESGEMTRQETIDFFQDLVNNGVAWTLQGRYGRTANALIEEGLIKRPEPPMSYPEVEEDPILLSLRKKMHPGRFPGMSAKMAAMVGYFLDTTYTTPFITGITVTSDGFAMVRTSEGQQIESMSDIELNLERLFGAIMDELTQEERTWWLGRFKEKIQD